jgi:hypothetical protein
MAGYSGTPLPKKLGIKEGHRVAFIGAPTTFDATLGAPLEGVTIARTARGAHAFDVIVLFAKAKADLEKQLPALAEALAYDGGLWVAWPKKASRVKTDVTEDGVRTRGLAIGLVDNKVCAIDGTWSALRLVYRVENRPKDRGAKITKGR